MITLSESELHAEVESPCHAFQAETSGSVQFWRVSARALSPVPALCKFSCSQASGDDLTDVLNYFNYVTGHTWDFIYNSGTSEYTQEDAIDPDTLEATSATALIDTDDFNAGQPPTWNNQNGYTVDPSITSTSGADWDKSSTRTALTAALDGVDWTALWAGSLTENNEFEYDRVAIAGNAQGQLPFGGTATGDLNGSHGLFGPNQLTPTTGWLDQLAQGARNISDDLGVSLTRTQIQIRNYQGTPIPYFFFEQAEACLGVAILGTSTARSPDQTVIQDTRIVYRKLTEGTWDHDLQIVQLPDPPMDGPQIISTATFGDRVRNGTYISMVVGMTFEDFMASILGPSWADFLFT